MSAPFIELIENAAIHKLRITSRHEMDYSFGGRSGICSREPGPRETMVSRETPSGHLNSGKKRRNPIGDFDPSAASADAAVLVDFLAKAGLYAWEILIRKQDIHRKISRGTGSLVTEFRHMSVMARMKPGKGDDYFEIGEGNSSGLKINYSGLTTRIDDVLRCNREAPPGRIRLDCPVILGPGDGGIIFHEILGHSLEADYMAEGVSPFSPADIGTRAVSDKLSIRVRDRQDMFFSGIRCDDDGETPSSKYLVKNGVLKSIVADTRFGNILGVKFRGFSRQESFARPPIPRMYGIYVAPGKTDPGEMIAGIREGVYAKEFGEGKVLFNQNLFYFHIQSAYMIRDGKVAEPLGRVVVQGKIDDALKGIDMIGTDFQYDRGVSYCQKKGQFLNVRIGQPTVRIGRLTVTRARNGN